LRGYYIKRPTREVRDPRGTSVDGRLVVRVLAD